MTSRLVAVALDCRDPEALAAFWCAVLRLPGARAVVRCGGYRLRRDRGRRRRDEAAQLEAERAAMQQEWAAAHSPDADAEVRTRMAAAVAAAITYIRAAQDRADYLQALAVRAQTLGFRVDVAQPPSPLPPLGQAILAEATAVLPWAQTTANHGVRASSVWTT